ncbi:DUF5343 domain-containing protein [Paraburkholderia aspalathi]|uniref:DUF5343 domain-containing protein n=1 Tax=Paraburkholderia aspalathi TaxID=1324617 RepID=UPI0038B7FE1C
MDQGDSVADKHPYTSGNAGLVQTIGQLRRAFPPQVNADTLKKLGIAPNNETYILNILKFLGVLDAEGKKDAKAASVFNKHGDTEFQEGFAEMVSAAYSDLFGLYRESAWTLATDKLISYFRSADNTSAIVGQRQATTFQTLASLSGKSDAPTRTVTSKAKKADAPSAKAAKSKSAAKPMDTAKVSVPPNGASDTNGQGSQPPAGMALTVRVEINLPAGGDQETYDRIFKSIRENLLNGNAS